MMMTSRRRLAAQAVCLMIIVGSGVAVACSGEPKGSATDTSVARPPVNDSSTGGALPAPVPGTAPAGATTQMTALGDSIFHGLAAGGICFTCHGADAKGTALAPPLVSHKWLTGDGSFAFIQDRVTKGVPTPTPPYTAAMAPMGGAQLTADQVKAVAAYVYSISHP